MNNTEHPVIWCQRYVLEGSNGTFAYVDAREGANGSAAGHIFARLGRNTRQFPDLEAAEIWLQGHSPNGVKVLRG